MAFADDPDSYLLLLLSDGNLPTGSFVSSSGLESYFKHGFPHVAANPATPAPNAKPPTQMDTTIIFVRDSLPSYARLSLPFVTDAYLAVQGFRDADSPSQTEAALQRLQDLDQLFEVMTLNHVAKRASRAQGVALLTLHSKGFSRPPWLDPLFEGVTLGEDQLLDGVSHASGQISLDVLVDAFKLLIRKGDTQGHLPICWGILTGALQLSLGWLFPPPPQALRSNTPPERSQFLFLFLYARSLLSAAIRLNSIGPYAAQQVLLHVVRPMVDGAMRAHSHLRTGSATARAPSSQQSNTDPEERWRRLEEDGPATTWPLGEILSARHDLQHSKIFNS